MILSGETTGNIVLFGIYQAGVVQGWGVGIAESKDLANWSRIDEVNTDTEATYEAKGFVAPCALVVKNKVHLPCVVKRRYQLYPKQNQPDF